MTRLLRHPLSLLIIGLLLFALFYAATMQATLVVGRSSPLGVATALGGVAGGWWAYHLYATRLERRPAFELAFKHSGAEVAKGVLAGFVLFATAAAGVAALGGLHIVGLRGAGNLWEMLAIALFSGFYEEVIFRGIVMRQLEALTGTGTALFATSVFFGLVHLANPGATLFTSMAIAMEAGILLGAAYLVTRRLWLAIGLHGAWNFTQGWVFSIPISGTGPSQGLLVTVRQGPEWLTGGAFGLEASVVALVVATGAGVVLLEKARRKGAFRSPGKPPRPPFGPDQTKL